MSLQGHHPIDIPFQQANGYQTDAPSAQHMYQSGYLPYQPEGYGNVSLINKTATYSERLDDLPNQCLRVQGQS